LESSHKMLMHKKIKWSNLSKLLHKIKAKKGRLNNHLHFLIKMKSK